ncbi:MAG: NosD domain-containing protein [Candidatus Hodarchaeota archaeon]
MNSQSICRRHRILLVFSSLVFLISLGWNQTDPGILESSDRIHQSFEAETCSHLHIPTVLASQQYVIHEPITITNNADFTAYGFPGDGSSSNPYVIESLNITSDARTLIHIENTTMYFRIQNNLLNGLINTYEIILDMMHVRDGISLVHATHGTIDSNIVINCGETGISLETSEQNILSNNNVSNCGIGISLGWSHQNTFSNNTISKCGIGIFLMASGQNSFVRNHLINNGFFILAGNKPYFQAAMMDNVVNGRPLVFWQNVRGGTIPPDAGQVVLINSTRIEVTGQDLTSSHSWCDGPLQLTLAHPSQ